MSFFLKPIIGGLPYHGLVTDGVLALPNNTTKPVSQPSPANVLLSASRIPGSSQTDLDTSNGWQWKDRLLVPGVTGLASTDVVFIDDAQVPYLIRVVTTKTGALSVNVTATLVREYGILQQGHGADYNLELFNQDYDLSTGAQLNLLSVKDAPDTVFGRVEQSPNGHSALINIAANFSSDAQYFLIDQDNWTICSVIKCAFSGEFDPSTLTGVTGTPSHYKTASDCCAPKSTAVISAPVNKLYRMGETDALLGWTPGGGANDWSQAVINMRSTFSTNETIGQDGSEIPTGADEAEITQRVIVYGHYDNSGGEHLLTFEIKANTKIDYGTPTINYAMTPAIIDWSYHCEHAFGSTFGCDLHPPTAGSGVDAVKNLYEDTSKVETRTYTVKLMSGASVLDSRVYTWVDDHDRISDVDYEYLEWPAGLGSELNKLKISADQTDEEAPWLYPAVNPNSLLSPTTKSAVGWPGATYADSTTVNTNTDQHAYISTEWGDVLYSGSVPPADQGFSNFDLGFVGLRFLTLANLRTSNKAPAQSAYGAAAANHAANIAYDPYTDTITDSDDPVGYI